jgi:signal transduction histidine kinase
MRSPDRYLYLAPAFSIVSHVIAFLQFAFHFQALSVPDRWFVQFCILMGLSLTTALLQFLLHKNQMARSSLVAVRAILLLVITYPLGNYINVRTTLLSSLLFENMIYLTFPTGLVVSVFLIAASLASPLVNSSWDRPTGRLMADNLLFLIFYPCTIMILGTLLKTAQRLAQDRKKLVEQLRQASSQLVDTNILLQEHAVKSENQATLLERERISRELHDTIGYTLMNIIATMKASLELAKSDPQRMRDFMTQGIGQAQKGLAETRAALRAMRSAATPPRSLVTSVDRLVKAFKDTHIAVKAQYSNIPWSFGGEIDAAIYRIAQEGIANAIRHGDATDITIHIALDAGRINVTISDNGGGAGEIRDGIGLTGIRERLDLLDGELEVGNVAGGFQLYAQIPLAEEAR